MQYFTQGRIVPAPQVALQERYVACEVIDSLRTLKHSRVPLTWHRLLGISRILLARSKRVSMSTLVLNYTIPRIAIQAPSLS